MRTEELKPSMSKDKLVKAGFDSRTLDRLMHSEEAYKVGYRTQGGHFRFLTDKLIAYLQKETRCR